MKRVEFLGANGVGKTTTMRFMLQRGGEVLLDQQQGRFTVAKASLGEVHPRKALARRVEFLLKSRRKRRARQLRDEVVSARLERDTGSVAAFVDHALGIITASNLSVHDKRAETSGFFDALYDALYLDSADLPRIALCDESISLKTLLLAMQASSDEAAMRLFELMPLPDAIVRMSGDEQAIYTRLSGRERGKTYTHIHYLRGCEESGVVERLEQLNRLAEKGCKVLAGRGCQVVHLDVDRHDLQAQADVLQPMLSQMAG